MLLLIAHSRGGFIFGNCVYERFVNRGIYGQGCNGKERESDGWNRNLNTEQLWYTPKRRYHFLFECFLLLWLLCHILLKSVSNHDLSCYCNPVLSLIIHPQCWCCCRVNETGYIWKYVILHSVMKTSSFKYRSHVMVSTKRGILSNEDRLSLDGMWCCPVYLVDILGQLII